MAASKRQQQYRSTQTGVLSNKTTDRIVNAGITLGVLSVAASYLGALVRR